MQIFFSDENLQRVFRRTSLAHLVVFYNNHATLLPAQKMGPETGPFQTLKALIINLFQNGRLALISRLFKGIGQLDQGGVTEFAADKRQADRQAGNIAGRYRDTCITGNRCK